jgi:3-oxoacyl-[acyl-carrier protein] reductase
MVLKDKVALITGASRGIGRAIAIEAAKNGASVAAVYNGNENAAKETLTEVLKYGVKAEIYKCDVSDFEAVKITVNEVIKTFGGVDILVNNAGVTADKLVMAMNEEDFDKVVAVNLKGAFNMIKHTSMNFIKRRAGRIINVSSVSGICGNAGQANYSSSKAGLIGLTKTVAREFASRNITCNAIAPGFIDTDMTEKLPENIKEQAISNIPLKRMGKPEEVAALAVFLASDAASYITGEVIKIDGGLCI